MARLGHFSPHCALCSCQALHVLAVVCQAQQFSGEPYHDLPTSITKLRLLLHFRMGCHSLPVEQGRLGRPSVPRHLRRCMLCAACAVGDERHCVFDCPCFRDLRQEHARLFDDAHCAMRCPMWHKDQKSVCSLILAIVAKAPDVKTDPFS